VSIVEPEAGSVRDVCRARRVLEGAGVRRWPDATDDQRDLVRSTLEAYIGSVHTDASYQELNERHLAFHVSLVGLTGSERLVAMAETLAVELRLALAQVERIRRNAHDQADSHAALVRLLEDGDIDGASVFLDRHLADAETSIIEALQL
jgi:DNA-binding GntR family transcriptional regulator